MGLKISLHVHAWKSSALSDEYSCYHYIICFIHTLTFCFCSLSTMLSTAILDGAQASTYTNTLIYRYTVVHINMCSLRLDHNAICTVQLIMKICNFTSQWLKRHNGYNSWHCSYSNLSYHFCLLVYTEKCGITGYYSILFIMSHRCAVFHTHV